MKRIISIALVLVMVLVVCTACGKPVDPAGSYADETGTSILEIGAYDYKAKSGSMKISSTLSDIVHEGTYTLAINEKKISSIITLTTTEGETMEFVYDAEQDIIQDLTSMILYYRSGSAADDASVNNDADASEGSTEG